MKTVLPTILSTWYSRMAWRTAPGLQAPLSAGVTFALNGSNPGDLLTWSSNFARAQLIRLARAVFLSIYDQAMS